MSYSTAATKRYILLFGAVVTACVVGVVLAAARCSFIDGGRGGAVGVAMSLFAIAIRPKIGTDLLDLIDRTAPDFKKTAAEDSGTKRPPLDAHELTTRMNAVYTAVSLSSRSERQSVGWLAWSTGVATVFWGFGDIFARCVNEWLVALDLVGICQSI